MQIYEIILIGLALSMDACALTISNYTTYKAQLSKGKEWAMPIAFAIFQGVMPLIGYLIGTAFSSVISSFSDWLTTIIFFLLSCKIVFDILKEKNENIQISEAKAETHVFTITVLLIQALATSIDALAIGVTFINLTFSVFIAVLIIAGVTFILVTLALFFGKYLGKLFGNYAEWIGAVILLLLSAKSLVQALA